MSTGRVLWLIWCLGWAGFWFFTGFATLGIAWLFAGMSLLAFLLPVGVPPRSQLPPPSHPVWLNPEVRSSIYQKDRGTDRDTT